MAIDDLIEEELFEKVFERFFEQAEIAKFNRKERLEYEDSLKVYRDWFSITETAINKSHAKGLAEGHEKGLAEGHAKGLAEGHEKGLVEGERKKNIENAKGFKAAGIPIATIAQVTGLTAKEIEKL